MRTNWKDKEMAERDNVPRGSLSVPDVSHLRIMRIPKTYKYKVDGGMVLDYSECAGHHFANDRC